MQTRARRAPRPLLPGEDGVVLGLFVCSDPSTSTPEPTAATATGPGGMRERRGTTQSTKGRSHSTTVGALYEHLYTKKRQGAQGLRLQLVMGIRTYDPSPPPNRSFYMTPFNCVSLRKLLLTNTPVSLLLGLNKLC